MDYLDPQQIAAFNQALARLSADYGRSLAQDTFDRGSAQQDYNRANTALGMQWDQARTQLPGSYAGRGLLNSGIYKAGLKDYATQRSFATDTLRSQYDRQVGQLNLNRQGLEDRYRQERDAVAESKNAAIASKAAQIRSFLN